MKRKILKKKIWLSIIIIMFGYVVWCRNYTFDTRKASIYATENALSKSHNCCAWFVMRAMHAGGCPSLILPAFAYEQYLPLIGWQEIHTTDFKEGDIVAFDKVKEHPFGHIAMWNGRQWISDFKQKNIIVNKNYKKYKIFRNSTS